MNPRDRELMMKLAFYALYEPSERTDEGASDLLEPLPREVSERRLKALLDTHFPSDSDDSEVPTSKRTTASHGRRWWRGAIEVGSVFALVAAVLLVWFFQRRPAPELMPEYDVVLHPVHPETMRGASPHDVQCPARPDKVHALVICLRPVQPIHGKLTVAAFAEPESGDGRWLSLETPGQSDEGVLMIEQSIASLGLSPGRWRIKFFVMHDSHGSHYALDELRALSPGAHPGVSVVAVDQDLGPGTAP